MATTYTLISSVTIGSGGAANITFSSIPATYTDLVVQASLRSTDSGSSLGLALTFNGTTSNFTNRFLNGGGSSGVSSSTTARYLGEYNASSSTASTFTNTLIYIPNYASGNFKSYSLDNAQEDNNTSAFVTFAAGLWSDTSAITSISLTRLSNGIGNFAQYSTAYLYGISNA